MKARQVRALSSVAPTLARLEEIEVRLPQIANELRDINAKPFPPNEAAERIKHFLHEQVLRFESREQPFLAMHGKYLVDAVSFSGAPVLDAKDWAMTLLWLLWPAVEKAVPAAVGRLDYDAGLGSQERGARVDALEREQQALVREHEELVDVANGSGVVTVAHLHETAQRRDREAHRRRVDEKTREHQAAVARRRERLDGVDRNWIE